MKKLVLLFALLALASVPLNAQKVCAHRGYWQCPEAGYAQNSIASLKLGQ